MSKDIITYNGREFQVSTVNIYGCFETMIFPIENDIPIGAEVYVWRTCDVNESRDKHDDVLNRPAKYLSEESIAEYLRLKEEDFWDFDEEDEEEMVHITKKEYAELLEYKYMYESLCD